MSRSVTALIMLAAILLPLGATANAQDVQEPDWVLVDHGRVLSREAAIEAGYFERRGRWLGKRWKKKIKIWDRLDRRHSEWSDAQKTRSDHYRVVSNLPAHVLDTEILEFLDQLFVAYSTFFKDEFGLSAKAADKKFIYIHKSLEDYARNTGGRSPEVARYNPGFIRGGSELVVYYDESDQEVFYNTVMHESAHQFVQALFPGAVFPIWIDEGLATYFEGCRYSRSQQRFEIGDVPFSRLMSAQSSLADRPDASMKELFMGVARPRFGAREYALAWSFIHFLNHGNKGRWHRSFVKFLKEMNGAGVKRSPSEVFEGISGRTFESLEDEWKAHLRGLSGGSRLWRIAVVGQDESLAAWGLRPGDELHQVAGKSVGNAAEFTAMWSEIAVGTEVDLVVGRKGVEGGRRFGLKLKKDPETVLNVRNSASREGGLID